ncbi:MAG: hypothetical protein JNL08_14410 [Planctomycetes bacterium]|nr:hypothetical protein [Planctomycetota bacterium]
MATAVDATRFAAMLGVPIADLTPGCRAALAAQPLVGEVLHGAEREAELLRALRAAEQPELARSGPHRAADWERGWRENLREYAAGDGSLTALMPKYNRHHVLRLQGQYLRVADPAFEYGVYTALRQQCFARWFRGLDGVAEFGCGTGTSLALLAGLLPQLSLWGLDWAESSQQILDRLGERIGHPIHGRRFDMFAPDAGFTLPPGTGVLTSAALEQIGGAHGPFVDYLLAQQPAICLHIEPILELYDEHTLFDYVARRYHRRRGYLEGFLPRLQQLDAERRIELLDVRRTGFGSFHHEGYSLVVWRPRAAGGRR